MRAAVCRLWLSVLSVLILFGMGLQALPIPCSGETCSASCAQSCATCPPTCTCHLQFAVAKPAPVDHGCHAAHGAHAHHDARALAHHAPDATSMQCHGGMGAPGWPNVALPNPPPPALVSAWSALALAQVPPVPAPSLRQRPATRTEPPFRPPAA